MALEDIIVNAVNRDLAKTAAAADKDSDKLRVHFPHSPRVGDFAQIDIPRI